MIVHQWSIAYGTVSSPLRYVFVTEYMWANVFLWLNDEFLIGSALQQKMFCYLTPPPPFQFLTTKQAQAPLKVTHNVHLIKMPKWRTTVHYW